MNNEGRLFMLFVRNCEFKKGKNFQPTKSHANSILLVLVIWSNLRMASSAKSRMGGRLTACTLTFPRQGAHGLLKLNLTILFGGLLLFWIGSYPTGQTQPIQFGGLFVRIDSMSFRVSAGESFGTNILHFGYWWGIEPLWEFECVEIRWRSKTFYDHKMHLGFPAVSKGSRPFRRVMPQ
jgi:hypothetical protein